MLSLHGMRGILDVSLSIASTHWQKTYKYMHHMFVYSFLNLSNLSCVVDLFFLILIFFFLYSCLLIYVKNNVKFFFKLFFFNLIFYTDIICCSLYVWYSLCLTLWLYVWYIMFLSLYLWCVQLTIEDMNECFIFINVIGNFRTPPSSVASIFRFRI